MTLTGPVEIVELAFNRALGMYKCVFEGQEWLALDGQAEHCNHLGSLHAGVLYAVAEAATGQALVRELAVRGRSLPTAVVRSASIRYRSPAQRFVRGLASVSEAACDRLEAQLEQHKPGLIDIDVTVLNEDDERSLTGHFRWVLR